MALQEAGYSRSPHPSPQPQSCPSACGCRFLQSQMLPLPPTADDDALGQQWVFPLLCRAGLMSLRASEFVP